MTEPRQLEFDLAGERLKERGMADAAESRSVVLRVARRIAREIALGNQYRECHADLVVARLREQLPGASLGNAAGSLFAGSDWYFTGKRVKSTRPESHCNELKVWRWVGAKT